MSYYAVHRGKTTGIFTNWNTVKPLVTGYSKPVYKKFKTKEEAEHFVQHGTIETYRKKDTILPIKTSELSVFTDGSHSTSTKKAAIGVAFSGPYHPYDYSERLPDNTTNQLAELYAVAKALEILTTQVLKTHPLASMEIWTDSKYTLDCVTKWVYNWRDNGWTTSNGAPVKYQHYIEYIRDQLDDLQGRCWIKHISELNLKSHGQPKPTDLVARFVWEGNRRADKLARQHTK